MEPLPVNNLDTQTWVSCTRVCVCVCVCVCLALSTVYSGCFWRGLGLVFFFHRLPKLNLPFSFAMHMLNDVSTNSPNFKFANF